MKFGKTLKNNRIPGWEEKYLNYDAAKKLLKPARRDLLEREFTEVGDEELECRQCHQRVSTKDGLAHLRLEHSVDKGANVHALLDAKEALFASDESADSVVNHFWRLVVGDIHQVDQWFIHQLEKLDENVVELSKQLDGWRAQYEMKGSKYNYRLKRARRLLGASLREQYQLAQNVEKYGSYNHLGVRKIVKKHDKMTNVVALYAVLDWLKDNGSFAGDRTVKQLMVRMEQLYAKYMTAGDESKARRVLRCKEESKPLRYIGVITGLCAGASFILLLMSLLAWSTDDHKEEWPRVRTTFLLFRMWMWPLLGLWYFGINVMLWQRGRINFIFIFSHVGNHYLKPKEIFVLAAMGTFLWSLTIAAYVATAQHPSYQVIDPQFYVYILSIVFVAALAWPFVQPMILYRRARLSSATEALRVFAAGFIDVTLMDFFVADQLTSVVPLFSDVLFHVCVLCGDVWSDTQHCVNDYEKIFNVAVGFIPSYFRLAQCLRRWGNEEGPHALNALKYLSQAPVVVFQGLNYWLSPTGHFTVWTGLLAASWFVAQYFRLYWDYAHDWRVFSRRRSPNYPLRAKTLYPLPAYWFAIVTNFLVRHLWIFTFFPYPYPAIVEWPLLFETVFGMLEVTRRFQWNIYRLETEQISNTGRYRQTKDIPLLYEQGGSSTSSASSGGGKGFTTTSDTTRQGLTRMLSSKLLSNRSYGSDEFGEILRAHRTAARRTPISPSSSSSSSDSLREEPAELALAQGTPQLPRDEDDEV